MFSSELAMDDIDAHINFNLSSTASEYIPDNCMYESLVLELERRGIKSFIET